MNVNLPFLLSGKTTKYWKFYVLTLVYFDNQTKNTSYFFNENVYSHKNLHTDI